MYRHATCGVGALQSTDLLLDSFRVNQSPPRAAGVSELALRLQSLLSRSSCLVLYPAVAGNHFIGPFVTVLSRAEKGAYNRRAFGFCFYLINVIAKLFQPLFCFSIARR